MWCIGLANFISDSFPVLNFRVTWAVPSRLTLGAGLRLLAHRFVPFGFGQWSVMSRALSPLTPPSCASAPSLHGAAYIVPGAVICADESDAYDLLPARYEVRRVNHGKEYRADDGTTNNLAESYFSRFRRFHIGQIHKAAPTYLDNYANEMAYREDTRRWSNGDIFRDILGKCARALVSRDWCGYWQGNHRLGESLAV